MGRGDRARTRWSCRGGRRAGLLRGLGWAALGFLPLLVATLAYNRHITGSFTEFPITAADARDNFGFGLKSIGERWTPTNFTPWIAVKGVGRNAWELPPFLFGSYVAVALTAVGLWLRRRDRGTLALLAIAAVFPVGYFFFWGISLSASFAHVSGPIYFIPLFLPVSILIATSLLAAWRRSRVLALGVLAVLVVATVPFMVDRVSNNHSISEAQVPWRDAEAEFDGRSLVIVERSGPYLLHLNPFSENTPDLDGRHPLRHRPRGREPRRHREPSRPHAYLQRTNLTTEETLADYDLPVPTVTVVPIEVERAPSFEVRSTVTAAGGPVVVASLRVGDQVHQQVLSTTATPTATRSTRCGDCDPAPPPRRRLPTSRSPTARGTVTVDAASGDYGRGRARWPARAGPVRYRLDGADVEVLTPLRTVPGERDRSRACANGGSAGSTRSTSRSARRPDRARPPPLHQHVGREQRDREPAELRHREQRAGRERDRRTACEQQATARGRGGERGRAPRRARRSTSATPAPPPRPRPTRARRRPPPSVPDPGTRPVAARPSGRRAPPRASAS